MSAGGRASERCGGWRFCSPRLFPAAFASASAPPTPEVIYLAPYLRDRDLTKKREAN